MKRLDVPSLGPIEIRSSQKKERQIKVQEIMLHLILYIFWLCSFCEIDGIRPTSTDLTPPASFMQYEKNMNRGGVVQHYCSVGVNSNTDYFSGKKNMNRGWGCPTLLQRWR